MPLKDTVQLPAVTVGLSRSDLLLDAHAVKVASQYMLRPLAANCETCCPVMTSLISLDSDCTATGEYQPCSFSVRRPALLGFRVVPHSEANLTYSRQLALQG